MKHFAGLAFLKLWAISSLFLFNQSVSAQDIAVGTWRTHFSYTDARIIEVTSDKIFCAAANGLFSIDLDDNSIRKLSKIDGLSDIGVSALKFDAASKVLAIGYRSGLVDFIFENEIITIRDIFNSNLEADKGINDITFGAGRAFLATDLGVIVVNIKRREIVENYVQIGMGGNEVSVLELSFSDNQLFARTNEGVQSGSSNLNLLDFNNWIHYPSTTSFTSLTLVDNRYYALNGTNVYQLSESSWIDTGVDLPSDASKLFSVNNELISAGLNAIYRFSNDTFEPAASLSLSFANDIEWVGNEFIVADATLGLINQSSISISPQGPISDEFSEVKGISNEIYAFHAPSPFSYDGTVKRNGYSFFSEGNWSQIDIANFQNISDVARIGDNFYFGSIGDGLLDLSNDQIIMDIPGSHPDLDTMIVAMNAKNNLWISSFDNAHPIHTLTDDGIWSSFSEADLFEDRFVSIDLTQTETAWLGGASGLITVFDPDQNKVDRISTSDDLPASYTDIDISVEDDGWVATTKGPALFSNASFVSGNTQAISPSFENRVLFEDELVSAVMTDGGNRVWFGTNRGLWVFNENTSEQVALFNESNSPIPSDNVLNLTYNPINGEVFITTDKGMVSFRSASSFGRRAHRDVTIFPNPVRPNYSGLVGIKGLAKNVSVKVTDINGNLVKEIEANGGTASWNLQDLTNANVVTGVYFLFSSSSDGTETFVGKIAVIR
jgi:hypothetical protein